VELHVFVCEDIEGIQFFLGDLFESIGALKVVGTAATERAAKFWLVANQGEWDLAVVDLVLQEGAGFGVIAAARQTHPQGRIAVFSSYLTPTVRAHCVQLGADAVFAKTDATGFVAWLSAQAGGRPSP
jgi:two-component system, OmpR family, response regulator